MNLGHVFNRISPVRFIAEICEVRRNEALYVDDAQLCADCGSPIYELSTSVAWLLLGGAIAVSIQEALRALH